jgi:hypothetical protein
VQRQEALTNSSEMPEQITAIGIVHHL